MPPQVRRPWGAGAHPPHHRQDGAALRALLLGAVAGLIRRRKGLAAGGFDVQVWLSTGQAEPGVGEPSVWGALQSEHVLGPCGEKGEAAQLPLQPSEGSTAFHNLLCSL